MHASAPEELVRLSDKDNERISSGTGPKVIAEARERLKSAPYAPVRGISCEYHDGVLILRGQVPSFFQKQLAQEAVLKLDGVRQVVNRIEVVDPGNGKVRSKGELP
jgi:osmotically-inducible protein OsmY